ncbi:hypothetical protein [Pseudoalteromonas phage vB_PalP_Y7]|nr:hypothetical protein [Pseudoalteromonas phage vB_PalP_Y7]
MSHQKMAATTKAMLVICTFGLSSFIAVAVAPPAIDKTYDNQDKLVEMTKLRNAGYLDDENGIEISLSNEQFAQANKKANDFLARNRESLNNQPSK